MIVETKVVGRRIPFERRPIELPDGSYTLRGLLTHLVHHEVAAYHERQDSVGVVRLMTERDIDDAALTGRVAATPQERGAAVSAEDATQTALTAFGDGLYYVFIDERQVQALDEAVMMRPDSTLLIVRLTALAGG